jgi:Prokaryotic N-terminal methylation motif
MKPKNGFLLIELMIGLSISTFFILIITHYIIEVKVTQQKALKRIEAFSLSRNKKERALAQQYGDSYA